MSIKPIKPIRIPHQVFEQIRELIYKGEFKAGQRIPPERELAMAMEVSRTSVRDAINQLVKIGLVEIRHGQGNFVCGQEKEIPAKKNETKITSEITYDDLLEARMSVECSAAMLAAQRATKEDLKELEKCLGEMEKDLTVNDQIGTDLQVAFHLAVNSSSKNPVLIHLMRSIYDLFFTSIKKQLGLMLTDRFALETVIGHHQTIFGAIHKRSEQDAFDAMQAHIRYVRDYLSKVMVP